MGLQTVSSNEDIIPVHTGRGESEDRALIGGEGRNCDEQLRRVSGASTDGVLGPQAARFQDKQNSTKVNGRRILLPRVFAVLVGVCRPEDRQR